MMAKNKRVLKLPDWFDLKKYKEIKSFGIDSWIVSLRIRKNILDSLKLREGSGLTLSELFELAKGLQQDLQHLRCNPLDIESGQHWALFVGNYEERTGITPIRCLKFSDLILQRQHDRHEVENGRDSVEEFARIKRLANRWKAITTPSHAAIKGELIDMPFGPIRGAGEPLLVDLRATDSVLVSAFTDWLKASRATRPHDTKSKRERPAYKDWAAYGLLPYLDLLIWQKETGNQITHKLMAQAVGYFRGGDSFRKTVPDLAADLMNGTALTELESLASIETTASI